MQLGIHGKNSADMQAVKVLIVDDSRLIRKALKKILTANGQIEVVGEAADGKEALAVIPSLQPDVITLDINMPEMDGLSTLKHIMIKCPTPTVMISSLTTEGAIKTFDALRLGAVDFISKPSQMGDARTQARQPDIAHIIKLVADVRIKKVRLSRVRPQPVGFPRSAVPEINRCVVFGASEGGYSSLLKIIPQLKPGASAVFMAVLYAAPSYVDAFVSYLDRYSPVTVERAADGKVLQGGTCYLAAGSEYITVVRENQALGLRVQPSPFPARRGAINMLMLSLSEIMAENAVGVILSGQEQDGAEGVTEIFRMGGDVIVQAPETCLFKEMPQTALKLCESCQIIPDIYIADAIDTLLHETLKREEESHVEKS